MSSATVRITKDTREVLRKLSAQTGEPMQAILDKAVDAYRRQRLLEDANRAYAALRSNPGAWEEELEERRLWDNAVADEGKTRG